MLHKAEAAVAVRFLGHCRVGAAQSRHFDFGAALFCLADPAKRALLTGEKFGNGKGLTRIRIAGCFSL